VRAFDRALAQLQACSIEDCGRVGAAAMEQARLTLQGWVSLCSCACRVGFTLNPKPRISGVAVNTRSIIGG